MSDFSDQNLRDWLLHRLDPARASAIEEALFADAALADRIEEVRADLLDDAAHARLTDDERPRLRRHLAATPDYRVRLRIARALAREHVWPARPFARRAAVWGGLGLAASVLLVAAVFWRDRGISPDAAQVAGVHAALPVISLAAVHQRGGDTVVTLPHYDGEARLQAEVDDAAGGRCTLVVADGDHVVFTAHGLEPHTAGPYRFVEAVVPASAFGSGVRHVRVLDDGASPQPNVGDWDVTMGGVLP